MQHGPGAPACLYRDIEAAARDAYQPYGMPFKNEYVASTLIWCPNARTPARTHDATAMHVLTRTARQAEEAEDREQGCPSERCSSSSSPALV